MALEEYVSSGFVRDGVLQLRNKRSFDRAMAQFRNGEVVVSIERRHAIRSQQQNRYWWGCVLRLLSEHTGYTVDELHEWAKAKFLPKALAFSDGNGVVVDELVVGGSTRRLNRLQFGEFVETVRRFAAERLDVVVPDPSPDWRECGGGPDAAA